MLTISVSGVQISAAAPAGMTLSGTLDPIACTAQLSNVGSEQVADPTTGLIVTVVATNSVTMQFSGNALTGHQNVDISANTPEQGLPCSISADFTGSK
jgi:hypothetical protein